MKPEILEVKAEALRQIKDFTGNENPDPDTLHDLLSDWWNHDREGNFYDITDEDLLLCLDLSTEKTGKEYLPILCQLGLRKLAKKYLLLTSNNPTNV